MAASALSDLAATRPLEDGKVERVTVLEAGEEAGIHPAIVRACPTSSGPACPSQFMSLYRRVQM